MRKLAIILVVIGLFSFKFSQSQNNTKNEGIPKWVQYMQDPSVNFYDVQREAEAFFKDKPTGKGTGWKQYKRWEYMNFDRTYPTGKRPDQMHLWNEMKKFKDKFIKGASL